MWHCRLCASYHVPCDVSLVHVNIHSQSHSSRLQVHHSTHLGNVCALLCRFCFPVHILPVSIQLLPIIRYLWYLWYSLNLSDLCDDDGCTFVKCLFLRFSWFEVVALMQQSGEDSFFFWFLGSGTRHFGQGVAFVCVCEWKSNYDKKTDCLESYGHKCNMYNHLTIYGYWNWARDTLIMKKKHLIWNRNYDENENCMLLSFILCKSKSKPSVVHNSIQFTSIQYNSS